MTAIPARRGGGNNPENQQHRTAFARFRRRIVDAYGDDESILAYVKGGLKRDGRAALFAVGALFRAAFERADGRAPYSTAEWIGWLRSQPGQAALDRVDRLLAQLPACRCVFFDRATVGDD
jgi:hypothetical protein